MFSYLEARNPVFMKFLFIKLFLDWSVNLAALWVGPFMWMSVQIFSHSHIFVNVHFITCCFKLDHFVLANNFLCVFASFIFFDTQSVCYFKSEHSKLCATENMNFSSTIFVCINIFLNTHIFGNSFATLFSSLLFLRSTWEKKVSLNLCTKHTHAQNIHNFLGSHIKRSQSHRHK